MNPALGGVLIVQGLFLLFALVFNGGVGERFVNYSFFLSAILMIVLGFSGVMKMNKKLSVTLGIITVILYLPMIWQRFNYESFIDVGPILFDAVIIGIVLFSVVAKPSYPLKRDEDKSGIS